MTKGISKRDKIARIRGKSGEITCLQREEEEKGEEKRRKNKAKRCPIDASSLDILYFFYILYFFRYKLLRYKDIKILRYKDIKI